jgi:uncharacterized damage-inducible protein DinB
MTSMDDTNDDKALMLKHLNVQRSHVLGALEGLTDEQLHRQVLPSGWTCIQLIKHLTIADEQYWFRCVMGGSPISELPTEPHGDWLLGVDETTESVMAMYRHEIELSDQLIASTGIDDAPEQPDPIWDEWGMSFPNLRSVMMHVITETAVHAGHLDAVREIIDGKQWVVLD